MDEREITHYFIVTNQLHRRMVESNLEGMQDCTGHSTGF